MSSVTSQMSSSSTRERPKAFTREPFFSGVPQAPCAVRASAEVYSWLFFSSLTRLCPLRYYPPLLFLSSNIPTRLYNLNLKEGGSGRSSLGGRWGNPTRAIRNPTQNPIPRPNPKVGSSSSSRIRIKNQSEEERSSLGWGVHIVAIYLRSSLRSSRCLFFKLLESSLV